MSGERSRGFADFTLTDTAVLRSLDLEGARIGELAARARMTPQGVGQIVQDLERRGYVRRRPDPTDGRAKRVVFTGKGRSLITTGQAVYRELEDEWIAVLGRPDFESLRRLLMELLSGTAPPGVRDVPGTVRSAAPAALMP